MSEWDLLITIVICVTIYNVVDRISEVAPKVANVLRWSPRERALSQTDSDFQDSES